MRRIWLDEAGLMKEEMFSVAIGRLRQRGVMGYLSATFTPQSKEHWTYKVLYDKDNPRLGIFHATTLDNPFLDREFYETLTKQYSLGEGGKLKALRELEGQWVDMGGVEWGPQYFGESIWFNNWHPAKDSIKIAALDTSKGVGGKRGDYSAFVLLQAADGILWVEADMQNDRNTSQIIERAIEIQRAFQPMAFGFEEAFGANVLADAIDRAIKGSPGSFKLAFNPVLVPTRNMRKEARIHRLGPWITDGFFRFRRTPGTRILVSQLQSWNPTTKTPEIHDDGPDALEMAMEICDEIGILDGFDEAPARELDDLPAAEELATALN
jgi:hypothetical protein